MEEAEYVPDTEQSASEEMGRSVEKLIEKVNLISEEKNEKFNSLEASMVEMLKRMMSMEQDLAGLKQREAPQFDYERIASLVALQLRTQVSAPARPSESPQPVPATPQRAPVEPTEKREQNQKGRR